MRLTKILLALLGLALFVWVVSDIPSEILRRPYDPGWAIVVIELSLIMTVLSAWRWKMISAAHGHHLSFWTAYRQFVMALGLAFLTPGRAGEFSRAWMGNKTQTHSTAIRLSLILQERLVDIFLLILLSVYGLWHMGLWKIGSQAVLILIALLFLGLIAVFVLRWLMRNKKGAFTAFVHAFGELYRQPSVTAGVALLTTLIWCGRILQLTVLVRALGETISFADAGGVLALGILVGLITFIPLGLGAQDFSYVFLFEHLGYALGFGNLVTAAYRTLINLPLIVVALLIYLFSKGPISSTSKPSAKS